MATRSTDLRPLSQSSTEGARSRRRRSGLGAPQRFKLASIGLLVGGLAASGSALATFASLEVFPVLIDGVEFQGGQALLALNIKNTNGNTISGISVSYDIGTQFPGWTYLNGAQTVCAVEDPAGVTFNGTTVLSLSGLDLDPGEECGPNVTLQIPIDATPGQHPTANLSPRTLTGSGDSGGVVVAPFASTNFWVLGRLTFEKEFVGGAYPGSTVELRFTITSRDTNFPYEGIAFTDDLDAALTGFASVSGAQANICGTGSTLSGTTELTFAGGLLPAGGSCSFSVIVEIPAGTTPDSYGDETSNIAGVLKFTTGGGSGDQTHPDDTSASANLVVLDPTARTLEFIERFMWNRAGTLMGAGPAFQYFVDRFYGNAENGVNFAPLAYQAIPNGGGAAFDAMLAPDGARWALWAEGTFERYREGGPGTLVNGRVAMAQAGLDVLLGDFILGVTVEGDAARELSTDFGYQVEGLGWMAGPYVAIHLMEGAVFDAKFLWGTSKNAISPFLTYTDEFTTTRWLATARVAGETVLGPVRIAPEIAFMYFSETQLEYVDTNGITIPEQTIGRARLTFGPELSIPVPTGDGGSVEPSFSFEGVWDILTSDIYARLGGGLQITGAHGGSLAVAGGYGGLFMPGFQTWNVSANITVPLH